MQFVGLGLILFSAVAFAEHNRQVSGQAEVTPGRPQEGPRPIEGNEASRRMRLDIPNAQGCAYVGADGSFLVSSSRSLYHFDKSGRMLKEVSFETLGDTVFGAPSLRGFIGRKQVDNEVVFSVLRDGTQKELPSNALPKIPSFPHFVVSPNGTMFVAGIEQPSEQDLPSHQRTPFYGVFDSEGKLLKEIKTPLGVQVIGFTPDERQMLAVSTGPPRLHRIDVESGAVETLEEFDNILRANLPFSGRHGGIGGDFAGLTAFSADGSKLAVSSNRLVVLDLKQGKTVLDERPLFEGYERKPRALAVSPNGSKVAFQVGEPSSGQLFIRALDGSYSPEPIPVFVPDSAFACSSFSQDGKKLLIIETKFKDLANFGVEGIWAREFDIDTLMNQ